MTLNEEQRLEAQNRGLRKRLAEFGVRSDDRRAGETLQEENRRLQEDLRWYLALLRIAG